MHPPHHDLGLESARAPRFPLNLPIRVRMQGQSEWQEGAICNTSSSGVLFDSPLDLLTGTTIELRIELRRKTDIPIECLAQIVRQEATVDGRPRLAARFQEPLEAGIFVRSVPPLPKP